MLLCSTFQNPELDASESETSAASQTFSSAGHLPAGPIPAVGGPTQQALPSLTVDRPLGRFLHICRYWSLKDREIPGPHQDQRALRGGPPCLEAQRWRALACFVSEKICPLHVPDQRSFKKVILPAAVRTGGVAFTALTRSWFALWLGHCLTTLPDYTVGA